MVGTQRPDQILIAAKIVSVLVTVVGTLHVEKLLALLLRFSELERTGKDAANTEKEFGQPAIFNVSIAAICPWKRVVSPPYVSSNILFLWLFFFFLLIKFRPRFPQKLYSVSQFSSPQYPW